MTFYANQHHTCKIFFNGAWLAYDGLNEKETPRCWSQALNTWSARKSFTLCLCLKRAAHSTPHIHTPLTSPIIVDLMLSTRAGNTLHIILVNILQRTNYCEMHGCPLFKKFTLRCVPLPNGVGKKESKGLL